ncbi:hypothetical protein, partial [Bordetella pertussis]|uniref:hypothetical protein n=1 Tax=Bordetella pertussis TaxID=520 RepID=UPI001C9E3461
MITRCGAAPAAGGHVDDGQRAARRRPGRKADGHGWPWALVSERVSAAQAAEGCRAQAAAGGARGCAP